MDLPPIETAEDVAKAMGATIRAMAAGVISADEAATVATILETQRRCLETASLEVRMQALEAAGAQAAGAPLLRRA